MDELSTRFTVDDLKGGRLETFLSLGWKVIELENFSGSLASRTIVLLRLQRSTSKAAQHK